MQNEKTVILGISIGTRQIGIAVMEPDELIDWHVKVFRGQWSERKLNSILRYFEKLADFYHIGAVALKIPGRIESSVGLQNLIIDSKGLFRQKQVPVFIYNIHDLKNFCFPEQRANKKTLIEYIVQKHEEVYYQSVKEKANKNSHYMKMFEAIVASKIALTSSQLKKKSKHTAGT